MAVEFNTAASLGINTGAPDFRALYDKISAKELDRLKPTEALQEKFKTSFATWNDAKTALVKVQEASDKLIDRNTFAAQSAISSDPDIVTASATSLAEPGKYLVVVDKTASFHQIGSQKYLAPDVKIGQGQISIGFEDERSRPLTIDSSNDTIQGLVDTINNAKLEITASLAKTGDVNSPYQVVLTSTRSGSEGRIIVKSNLTGGDAPNFDYRAEQPSKWYYAPGKKLDDLGGTQGASSTIPKIGGTFTGADDVVFQFSAVSSGRIGGEGNPAVAWRDSTGRNGLLKLGRYEYQPGQELEVADGLTISFSDGETVQDDMFTIQGNAASPPFLGIFGKDEPASFSMASNWSKQKGGGRPMIEGTYTGAEDDVYHFTVRQGGVIGTSPNVLLDYTSDNGEKGTLDFGLEYKPGTKFSIGNGLSVSLPTGVLQDGFTTDFSTNPAIGSDRWWLFDDGNTDGSPSGVSRVLDWSGQNTISTDPDVYDPRSKKSNAEKVVTGDYLLDVDKKYKFTVRGEGRVGVSTGLYLDWEDNTGKKGELEIGADYNIGSEVPFDGGLNIALKDGFAFDGDYFFVDAFTPTIQGANDAQIRIGVDASGNGGQTFTSPTNEFIDAIPGVTLNAIKADPKVVTITIEQDREKVKEAIKEFILSYNDALNFIQSAVKYDPETKIAGPLQAERNLVQIQESLRKILVEAIPGLPTDANTLPFAGVKITKDATIDFDEALLDERLASDYDRVADIFRSYAKTNNPSIRYAGSAGQTKASGTKGYDIDITQAPTPGKYTSASFTDFITIPPGEHSFVLNLDGKQSTPIKLESGDWSLRQIRREIVKAVDSDAGLKGLKPKIEVLDNRLVITSDKYASNSAVSITPFENSVIPFANGSTTTQGTSVAGTINGHQAIGSGQLLIGSDDTPEKGLQFFVTLGNAQINQGQPEANAVFSIGKGGITKGYLDEQLKNNTGPVDTSIKAYSERVENLDDRLTLQKDRIDRKKERLSKQFINAEKKIGELKSQQQSLSFQGLPTG